MVHKEQEKINYKGCQKRKKTNFHLSQKRENAKE